MNILKGKFMFNKIKSNVLFLAVLGVYAIFFTPSAMAAEKDFCSMTDITCEKSYNNYSDYKKDGNGDGWSNETLRNVVPINVFFRQVNFPKNSSIDFEYKASASNPSSSNSCGAAGVCPSNITSYSYGAGSNSKNLSDLKGDINDSKFSYVQGLLHINSNQLETGDVQHTMYSHSSSFFTQYRLFNGSLLGGNNVIKGDSVKNNTFNFLYMNSLYYSDGSDQKQFRFGDSRDTAQPRIFALELPGNNIDLGSFILKYNNEKVSDLSLSLSKNLVYYRYPENNNPNFKGILSSMAIPPLKVSSNFKTPKNIRFYINISKERPIANNYGYSALGRILPSTHHHDLQDDMYYGADITIIMACVPPNRGQKEPCEGYEGETSACYIKCDPSNIPTKN